MIGHSRVRVVALSGALLTFAASAGHAQTSEPCGPFTVTSPGQPFSVKYLDFGENGPSFGDMRIGHRDDVVNEAGDPVGHLRWIVISLDEPPGSDQQGERHLSLSLNLRGGQIHASALLEEIRPSDDTTQPGVNDYSAAVVGGTGAYNFARGSVDASFDGTAGTFAFDIACD